MSVPSLMPVMPEEEKLEVIPTGPDENDSDFQEGGLRGWLIVLGAFLVKFCGFGYTDSFGVYQDYYTRVYITNQSASAISWIGTVNAFLVTTGGLYAGVLYDRGYFYHLLYGSSFLISCSLWLLSFAKPDNFYQNFLAQGIGLGLGGGLMHVPSTAVISLYFRKKQALAMTLAAAGSFSGGLVNPIMLNYLFYSRLGFAGTIRASAGLTTFILLMACIFMRPKLPPPIKRPTIVTLIRKIYKDGAYVTMCIGNVFFAVGLYFPLFYIQLDATKHGISTNFAFNSLVILNGSSLFGCVSPGFFAHSLGVMNMLVAASFACTLFIFTMIRLTNIPSLVVIAVLCGYSSGMFLALVSPLVSVLTTDVSELGARLGIAYTFFALGGLIGPPFHGSLLTSEFIWWRPAVAAGISALIGSSLYAALCFIKKRKET